MKPFRSALLLLTATVLLGQAAPNQNPAPPASATEAMYKVAADSGARKVEHIQENAEQPRPDQRPTVLTEREVNSYLSSGRVKLPNGVRSVSFTGTPGVVNAHARVDFDAITVGKANMNPLMGIFSGVHDVDASAHASGAGGQGQVHIDSISIDGMGVPRMALEFFVDHYLRPKHPEIGLDSTFKLPERIDMATVGQHTLTVTQK
jgi:hypothetical protein